MEGTPYTRQRIHICKALTNLVSPKKHPRIQIYFTSGPHGDVVDGIVITSSVGMLTLDVLGGVGGPACHNKGLWSQSQLPWEHDCQPRMETVQSNCPSYIRSLLVGQSQVMPKADSIVH